MRCGARAAEAGKAKAPSSSYQGGGAGMLVPFLGVVLLVGGIWFGLKKYKSWHDTKAAKDTEHARSHGQQTPEQYPQFDADIRVQARDDGRFWLAGTLRNKGPHAIVDALFSLDCKLNGRVDLHLGPIAAGAAQPYEHLMFDGKPNVPAAYCEGGLQWIDLGP